MVEVIFFLVVIAVLIVLLIAVPSLSITIPSNIATTLISICKTASYLLPIKLLMPLIIFSFAFNTFIFSWAVFLRVKSFFGGVP